MKKQALALCAVLTTLSFIVSSQAQTNLVVNGNFATLDFTGWTLNSFDGSDGVADNGDGTGTAEFPDAGGQALLSQTLATTPGDTYYISFLLENQYFGPTSIFSFSWDGGQLYSEEHDEDPEAYGGYNFTLFTFQEVASSSSTVIQFAAQNDTGAYELQSVSVTPTPEPSTLALTSIGGIAGFILIRRKR